MWSSWYYQWWSVKSHTVNSFMRVFGRAKIVFFFSFSISYLSYHVRYVFSSFFLRLHMIMIFSFFFCVYFVIGHLLLIVIVWCLFHVLPSSYFIIYYLLDSYRVGCLLSTACLLADWKDNKRISSISLSISLCSARVNAFASPLPIVRSPLLTCFP